MNLLVAADQPTASALNAKAFAFTTSTQDAKGGAWSALYTDGSRFGILFDNSIVGAFTDAELDTTVDANGNPAYSNVVAGALVPDGGTWEAVP